MSFEFRANEAVDHGARRVARKELDDVIAALSSRSTGGRPKRIHEARKSLKKLRALVRLVRGGIGKRAARRENAAFRDAGRALSAARDAAVLVGAFDQLVEHFRGHVSGGSFGLVRRRLLARRREAMKQQGGSVAEVVRCLRESKRHVAKWNVGGGGFDAISPGLKRIFRQGRHAFAAARQDPQFEKLHELRKRVKDLWHATQLIEPAWPEELRPLGQRLHDLSDLLGDDHDLAVLRQTIEADPQAFGPATDVEALLALADARRGELQEAAMELAAHVYAERPKAFVRRMGEYWEAWGEKGEQGPKVR